MRLGLCCVLLVGCDDEDSDDDATHTPPPVTSGPLTGTSDARIDAILALEGDLAAGSDFYDANCETCHRDDGTGITNGSQGADLTLSTLSEPAVVATVLRGIPDTTMDAYDDYQNQQIADVTTYVFDTFIAD
jgi:mono/diheme cytochrome c family protein